MVLEGIEDYLRGWQGEKTGLGGERVARGSTRSSMSCPGSGRRIGSRIPQALPSKRDKLVHTLGQSHAADRTSQQQRVQWPVGTASAAGCRRHDVLLLNRKLLESATDDWTDESIRARTRDLIEVIIRVWPVPEGHKSGFASERPRRRSKLQLSDLLSAGALQPGIAADAAPSEVQQQSRGTAARRADRIRGQDLLAPVRGCGISDGPRNERLVVLLRRSEGKDVARTNSQRLS